MKRPMLLVGVSFAVALWASFLWGWGGAAALLLGAAGAVALLLYRVLDAGRWQHVGVVLVCAMLAILVRQRYLAREVQPLQQAEGELVAVRGVVTDMTVYSGSADYTVKVAFPGLEEVFPQQTTLVLRAYALEHLPGDAFEGVVRLQALNPTSAQRYHARGIHMRATLIESYTVETSPFEFTRLTVDLRERMRMQLYLRFSPDAAGLLSAMALGQTGGLRPEASDALSRSGVAHLLSVSGLHLSILVGGLLSLLETLRVRKGARVLIALSCGALFALLVGFGPSVTRALAMLAIAQLASLFSQRADTLNSLGISLLVLCAVFPHWTLSRSLWLSAASTAGIAAFAGPLKAAIFAGVARRGRTPGRIIRSLLGALAVSLSAYVFSLPILMLTSGWISLVAPVANLLVAPLIVPVLVGGMLCAWLPNGVLLRVLVPLVEFCADMLVGVASILAELPFAVFAVNELWRFVALAGACILVAMLVHWRARRRQWSLGALLCVVLLFVGTFSMQVLAADEVEVVSLDGCDATLILHGDQAVVVGTPTPYEIRQLLSYLSFREVQGISAVVATDSPDRVGSGLLELQRVYPVGCVFAPDDEYTMNALREALGDTPVYPASQSIIRLLSDVYVITGLETGTLIDVGGARVRKLPLDYLREAEHEDTARIYQGGVLVWSDAAPPSLDPIGRLLYGETRLVLER